MRMELMWVRNPPAPLNSISLIKLDFIRGRHLGVVRYGPRYTRSFEYGNLLPESGFLKERVFELSR